MSTAGVNNSTYRTSGPNDTFNVKDDVPPQPLQVCYTLDTSTCRDDQIDAVLNESATVRQWIVVDKNSTQLYPDIVGNATYSQTPANSPSVSAAAAPVTVKSLDWTLNMAPWLILGCLTYAGI